ncbi:MAG: hypothetical protein ACYDA4_13655 [Ignavibacteriaceae bacterium]
MLLETLEVKKNDVVIFSQNIFDLKKNFKIIFKDDPEKQIKNIDYAGVCNFVNEFNPKNLIVYRLLTNIKNFEIYLSKYGFVININGNPELIYFDPVFAIKELEDYSEAINHYDLRFRIQQVGLTTLNRIGELPNFAEIYCIDLEASEAKSQNDKTFAEVILFTPKKIPSSLNTPIKTDKLKEISKGKKSTEAKDEIIIKSHNIAEDKDYDYKQIREIKFKPSQNLPELTKLSKNRDERLLQTEEVKDSNLPKNSREVQTTFGKFLKSRQENTTSRKDPISSAEVETKNRLIELFKSSASMNKKINGKENRQVVLKLDKK